MKKQQLKIGEDGLIFLSEMRNDKDLIVNYYSPEFVDISYEPGTKFIVRTDLHEGDFCDGGYFLNEMRTMLSIIHLKC